MSDEYDSYESDLSFEFEEEGYSSEETESQDSPGSNGSPASESTSPNALCKLTYRSFPMLSFIEENFIAKAQDLRSLFLPDFSVDQLLIMLQYKNWLKLEVLSDYYDNWPKFREACGLCKESGHERFKTVKDFMCPVCCESGDLQVFSLQCNHEYCSTCYRTYVETTALHGAIVRCIEPLCNLAVLHLDIVSLINTLPTGVSLTEELQKLDLKKNNETDGEEEEDSDTDLLSLETSETNRNDPSPFHVTADLYFDVFDFSKTLTSTDGLDHLNDINPLLNSPALLQAARISVDSRFKKFSWCPALDCPSVVQLETFVNKTDSNQKHESRLSKVPIVACFKSHEFCFNCRFENHLPSPCWLAEKWIKKCSDDSETLNWLQAHTQGCPECLALIEKNGGCNHVVCRKCQYEFCWICFGPWSEHKSSFWQCNRFVPEEVKETELNKSKHLLSLSRYLHYYQRFAAHQISMAGDYKTLGTIHAHMLNYMKYTSFTERNSISWNDIQYLSDSYKGLCAGRKTLMWSYAFAFYLCPNNFSTIFESMQDFLNDTVEKLSQLLEQLKLMQPSKTLRVLIANKREKFVELTALVLQRRRMLIDCANSGIEKGDLVFLQAS